MIHRKRLLDTPKESQIIDGEKMNLICDYIMKYYSDGKNYWYYGDHDLSLTPAEISYIKLYGYEVGRSKFSTYISWRSKRT